MAEQGRFERPLAVTPLSVFKTDLFNHLSIAPSNKKRLSALNGGCYRDRTYDLLYVKQMLSQLS